MNLREALESYLPDPVLFNDGADYWTVANLLEELNENDLDDEDYLNREVYSCSDYIAFLDQSGYQIKPARYTIYHIGETPYFVRHDADDYQVRLMISEKHDHSRPIHGQHRYAQKQAAYRRKSQLNGEWQKNRVLDA